MSMGGDRLHITSVACIAEFPHRSKAVLFKRFLQAVASPGVPP